MIKYIVLAEFDLNLGAIVNIQYPQGQLTDYDEENLANYMLTEGSHKRERDENVFMLRKKNDTKPQQLFLDPKANIDDFVETVYASEHAIYFISIMQNKVDEKYKRGSLVKALALGSQCRYIEPFKKIMEVALEDIMSSYDPNKSQKENNSTAEGIIQKLYKLCNSSSIDMKYFYYISKIKKICLYERKLLKMQSWTSIEKK